MPTWKEGWKKKEKRWKPIGSNAADCSETDVWIFICSENQEIASVTVTVYISRNSNLSFTGWTIEKE